MGVAVGLQTGDTSLLTKVTSSIMGKENAAADASAVVNLALKLQQLLAEASSLRQASLADTDDSCNGVSLKRNYAVTPSMCVC